MANLTFKSNGATKVALIKVGSPYITTIQYSKNGGAWSNVQLGTAISLTNNDIVSFSGNARFSKNIQNKYQFTTAGEGTLTLSGDLISLVSGNTVEDDYEFNSLFKDCENIVDASQLTLPSNTTNWCYTNMFFGCTNLSAAPTFVATEVKQWSYANMFVKCFALSTAPTLPTAVQNDHSCSNMFQNCTSLQNCPNIYNTRNGTWMYNAMFEGCTNLNVLPNFPFSQGSTPSGGYSSIFKNCNNITLAPRFNYTTLKSNSFNFMYNNAKNVNAVEVAFSSWLDLTATSCWLKNASPTGTFVCPSALDTSIRSYNTVPQNWNVLNYQTMPLTFRAIQPNTLGTVKLVKVGNPSGISLSYRKNYDGNWNPYFVGTTITLNPGQCVSFSGSTNHFSTTASGATPAFYRFQTSGATMYLYGKLTSLANNASRIQEHSQFAYLFAGCTNIYDAQRLYFPSNTQDYCYAHMFSGCTSLRYSPLELPAAIVNQDSYRNMFNSCTNLVQSPQIRVSDASYKYSMNSMFYNCSSISAIWIDLGSWPNESYNYYALHSWTYGVPASGRFFKPTGLPQIYNSETGCYNRIPNGWTVINH